ncbi:hypothetical protein FQN50_005865 [Emmonsiellopsis sp. PD_5]|nr:hypothetical protein FQN50_005865 [Emmonsiellopsis sp. PD_5]
MVFKPNTTVQPFETAADFVEYLLNGDASAITLVVCSTREAFLQQFCPSIARASLHEDPVASPQPAQDRTSNDRNILLNPQLYNTIRLISQSRRVTLAFCPTLDHFRAYISVFHTPIPPLEGDSRYPGRQVLAILDLLALHYQAREFSAQGIAKTLALAVEVSAREGVNLTICECNDVNREDDTRSSMWDRDIPLLGDQRRATEEGFQSRTLKAKQVAKRWFNFV